MDAQHYHLGESTFIFMGLRSDFKFSFHFLMKFLYANRIATDGTLCYVASHLGLYCLSMSYKKDSMSSKIPLSLLSLKAISYLTDFLLCLKSM